jgi:hypothetical protein
VVTESTAETSKLQKKRHKHGAILRLFWQEHGDNGRIYRSCCQTTPTKRKTNKEKQTISTRSKTIRQYLVRKYLRQLQHQQIEVSRYDNQEILLVFFGLRQPQHP